MLKPNDGVCLLFCKMYCAYLMLYIYDLRENIYFLFGLLIYFVFIYILYLYREKTTIRKSVLLPYVGITERLSHQFIFTSHYILFINLNGEQFC